MVRLANSAGLFVVLRVRVPPGPRVRPRRQSESSSLGELLTACNGIGENCTPPPFFRRRVHRSGHSVHHKHYTCVWLHTSLHIYTRRVWGKSIEWKQQDGTAAMFSPSRIFMRPIMKMTTSRLGRFAPSASKLPQTQ